LVRKERPRETGGVLFSLIVRFIGKHIGPQVEGYVLFAASDQVVRGQVGNATYYLEDRIQGQPNAVLILAIGRPTYSDPISERA
jgi:hypothetical protein